MTRFLHFPCYNNLSDILMSNRFAFNIIYWTLSTMTTLIWVSDPPSVCVYINILVLFSVSRIQILSSNSNKALLKFQRFYFMAENAISRRVQSFYGKFTEWRSRERRWEVIQFFQFRWWLDFDINNILSSVRFFDRYGRVRNIFIKDGKYGFCVSVVCHWLTFWAHQNWFLVFFTCLFFLQN